MKPFLLFLSIFIFSIANYGQTDQIYTEKQVSKKYGFNLNYKGGGLSGFMLLSDRDDYVAGSIVNEFGFSAVDFLYQKKTDKVKLLSIIKFLDKWYIRPTLRNDIREIVCHLYGYQCKRNKNIEINESYDSTIMIIDKKRGLSYIIRPFGEARFSETNN